MKKIWLLIIVALLIIISFAQFIKGPTICPTVSPCFGSKISPVEWIRHRLNRADSTDPLIRATKEYLYVNSDHHFQITLTNAWKGYEVVSTQGSQGIGSPTYLAFSVPDFRDGYEAPFTITIFEKEDGRTYQGTGVKITEDSQNSYYYVVNEDLPDELKSINFNIPKVISTFKITQ